MNRRQLIDDFQTDRAVLLGHDDAPEVAMIRRLPIRDVSVSPEFRWTGQIGVHLLREFTNVNLVIVFSMKCGGIGCRDRKCPWVRAPATER